MGAGDGGRERRDWREREVSSDSGALRTRYSRLHGLISIGACLESQGLVVYVVLASYSGRLFVWVTFNEHKWITFPYRRNITPGLSISLC
jgi:hypothetical protein